MGIEKNLADFLPSDVEAVVASERNYAARYNRQSEPRAILLAGQPGAGKTVLSSMLNKLLCGNVYFINADEYRRFHPNYKELYARYGSVSVQMTSGFSGAVTERLIHETSERGIHLIIEGTGRTTDVPHRTAELLVKKGYRVELAVIATRPEHSLCSTLLRFYEMNERGTIPRATAMEAHDYVVRVLPDNLDILRDDPVISGITIWDRTPTKIYDSCGTAECPSEVLRQYWNRPWSDEELQDMQRSILRLRHKEEACQLKQSPSIDELERRVQEAAMGPGFTFNTMM